MVLASLLDTGPLIRFLAAGSACLVRLSEKHAAGEVFTLDSDFRVYRRHGNRVFRF